ncbi:MAG: hypothetical protein A2931_01465 [Candidatus Niyogibacteria bacterium RIFCSPLOWO2_01_FULL_45_48]|uniref:Uncharacterized protein n=1 Tax=Candidatus Niyogibacteria bacterium RIFCSPLOWO2_01_FULL_45_48 TaxID=1801724 RepID=A0A1G2EUM7_9BACT|nr:MAG: hypothetical protein A2931_01465 [Candidatus Niyogibacteria bacterium RIFCSPLOWO2_01_FULL_45_48]OGZ29974.1 MAG: hypothetical protein A2835_02810 [Candidatus Niyogibacteria bacterium RIFCSPHIGHO2_01_FULL_45_28]
MNFLEELTAEWHEYKGFFVRRNIRFGGAAGESTGGHSGDIDVLAYRPKDNTLLHVETSSDYDSWEGRRIRFTGKKFTELAMAECVKVVGFTPKVIKRIAIVSHTRKPAGLKWQTKNGLPIEIIDIPTFITIILDELRDKKHARQVGISEQLPLLRAMHYAVSYGQKLKK